ncbi:13E12 repeat family protein, partial [Mycobacterium asiaticum]
MVASSREEIVAVFDALDAEAERLSALSFDALTTPELMRALDRLERDERRKRAVRHALINQLQARASTEELGGTLASAMADRLRITKAEASRRIAEAEELGPRRALTGQPLAPLLIATAAAQCRGLIGDAHVKVIRRFFANLPHHVDVFTREAAEADLAGRACEFRPDQVAAYARKLMTTLHPDGDYSDEDRARKRGVVLGNQDYDGMSRISGLITPELRALFEALLAALAAPGTPDTDSADSVGSDIRSTGQRNHDALIAAIRALFASGELGQHRGLPVTVIVTTTLKDLEAGAGKARTSGGSLLPMADLIRMAAQAHHYLAVFDDAKPLALYHAKRLASPAQRLMLHALDRGCTRPGCDQPAYHSEV